ncbi:hypothetical protein L1987_72189 [Smallanthus sonchifolius]|uniref:Uncharacterized protein n=1 Tax=Smallanthus sonchifolius TaxID=185202 RepID=A0ACB9AUT6_9ASTR|nr:hypothetical protein L1987_72189 [Smallanthus sonchifolius]
MILSTKSCLSLGLKKLLRRVRCHLDGDRKGEFFKDDYPFRFSTDTLHSLEKFDLSILCPDVTDASKMFGMLQHLYGVKFLTLNLELVEDPKSQRHKCNITSRDGPWFKKASLSVRRVAPKAAVAALQRWQGKVFGALQGKAP